MRLEVSTIVPEPPPRPKPRCGGQPPNTLEDRVKRVNLNGGSRRELAKLVRALLASPMAPRAPRARPGGAGAALGTGAGVTPPSSSKLCGFAGGPRTPARGPVLSARLFPQVRLTRTGAGALYDGEEWASAGTR